LDRLGAEHFDVLVVGGGITGAGVALDAASRGLSTALVDKGDFASGTSSKSSKLVHGGIRYLQQRELRLVYENLAERQRLLQNAPHLVTPVEFLIPLFGHEGVASAAVVRATTAALWLYDLTGGVRIGHRHRRVDAVEARRLLPALRPDRVVAGFIYWDARADDARLTLAVARTAVLDHGAVAANHAPVTELVRDRSGRVTGARVDAGSGSPVEVSASVVVNAGGVWADDVSALAGHGHPRSLRPAKGVHVTVPFDRLPCAAAAVVPVAGDHRSVFVVPWPEGGFVYVGTTDTDYDGPLDDPACTPADVDYLLGAVNAATTAELTRRDVTAVWSGLRPLVAPGPRRRSARTADLSRRHRVTVGTDGVVTVTGGKLTTYRKMAADAVDLVVRRLGRPVGPVTRRLPLHGAPAPGFPSPEGHLGARYGTEAPAVAALAEAHPALADPVVDGLPYIGAEVVWAVRAEMARTLADVLDRRLRARLLDARATAAAAPRVAELVGAELGWDAGRRHEEAAAYAAGVLAELETAGLVTPVGRP
jgi:glycerol-3-phosphate dehydrogenase